MTKNIILLGLLLGAAGVYTVFSESFTPQQTPAQTQSQQSVSTVAPDFQFIAMDGKNYATESFRGKPVILNFWASWCAPCIVEFPQMIRLAEHNKYVTFLFLGVGETQTTAKQFVQKYLSAALPPNVVIGLDTEKVISESLFKTYKLPETYLIDSSFGIADKIIGNSVDWEGKEIADKIKNLSRD